MVFNTCNHKNWNSGHPLDSCRQLLPDCPSFCIGKAIPSKIS